MKFQINDRVRVHIQKPERYAHDCAEVLNGKAGTITKFNEKSINGEPILGPAYLVQFDKPARRWWKYQTRPMSFWFPPQDLRIA